MMHPRGEVSPRTKAYRLRDSEIGLPHVFSVGGARWRQSSDQVDARGRSLAWVVVMASVMAVLVQYLAAKVGLSTTRTLPELCCDRFGAQIGRAHV